MIWAALGVGAWRYFGVGEEVAVGLEIFVDGCF